MSVEPTKDFFQCPHCRKRYAASAKVQAASGRTVRCKACGEPFVIAIESLPKSETLPVVSTVAQQDVAEASQPVAQVSAKRRSAKQQPAAPTKEKGRSSALLWGVGVAGVLLVAGGVAFWWLQPSWFAPDQTFSQIPPQQPAVDDSPALPDAAEVADQLREVAVVDPASRDFYAAVGCREVAAQQWLNDYTLTHTRYKQHEFVRLLDQSSALTAQMHKRCRNLLLLRSVIGSAKEGKKPAWLLSDINALLHPVYNEDQIVGDTGL
ncbi:MAG: hypothetical protein Q9M26_09060 [Mariprofundales bacterium]|nr:hypothetical protein [Mariprofundales bacterium]